jgi:hypothetical protein
VNAPAMMGPSFTAMVRHDLADLVRSLGARCAARACLTAATREEWAEIADDVRALVRHDDQRCQYTAAMRAARSMGCDDAADALDWIVDLTGESVEEWASRVTREMGGAR